MKRNSKSATFLFGLCFVIWIFMALACESGSENSAKDGSLRESKKISGQTTIVLVRHAEKAEYPADNPGLTEDGERRARLLKELLWDKQVTAIYTSRFRRTQETAAPLAEALGITPVALDEGEKIAESIVENNRGETILVVAHTNTIPVIIRNLGGGEIEPIAETEFDKMFILAVDADNTARLIATKY